MHRWRLQVASRPEMQRNADFQAAKGKKYSLLCAVKQTMVRKTGPGVDHEAFPLDSKQGVGVGVVRRVVRSSIHLDTFARFGGKLCIRSTQKEDSPVRGIGLPSFYLPNSHCTIQYTGLSPQSSPSLPLPLSLSVSQSEVWSGLGLPLIPQLCFSSAASTN